nr:hypothetical protein [Kibdelosporangium sp. MJ126-NF4]CEL20771.1 hypothetical protein [Kibdelosporangium sp. MJ126-NF4]CTQ90706.1 hypothetical protein [Kibdelosporangium sp. MJ126-NF4]
MRVSFELAFLIGFRWAQASRSTPRTRAQVADERMVERVRPQR